MEQNHENILSFTDEYDRGKYARDLRKMFQNNSLSRWHVYASVKTQEVCIEPAKWTYKEFLWENLKSISRISIEVKDNKFSFGVSGYFPSRILSNYPIYEKKGYKYHDKEGNTSPKQVAALHNGEKGKINGSKGRWWMTKSLYSLEDIVHEFKDIESLLYNNE